MPQICADSLALLHGIAPEEVGAFLTEIDALAREEGCTFCWPYLHKGELKAGSDMAALTTWLAGRSTGAIGKASASTFGAAVSRRHCAGLTVSAGLPVARQRGASAYVNVGLGGVHLRTTGDQAATAALDISADLHAIAQSGLPVFCAGFKPFIDAEASLSQLDALGVPLIQIGQARLPALYANDYAVHAPIAAQSVEEAWAIWQAHKSFQSNVGAIICVPIPQVAAIDTATLQDATAEALLALDVSGPGVTPTLVRTLRAKIGPALDNANKAALKQAAITAMQCVQHPQ